MASLLEKRQMATIKNLQKRKAAAQAFIASHTQKLEEKLIPYNAEVELCDRMMTEYKAANPSLDIDDESQRLVPRNADTAA